MSVDDQFAVLVLDASVPADVFAKVCVCVRAFKGLLERLL